MAEIEYDGDGSSGRYLILSDATQEFPTERLRVVSAEMRDGNSGKPFPVLTLRGEDSGKDFSCAAFSRDVRACVAEWGKKTGGWGFVTFRTLPHSTRRELVPCARQSPNEEVIAAETLAARS